MKNCFLAIAFLAQIFTVSSAEFDSTQFTSDSIPTEVSSSQFSYSISPSFGLTFQNISKSDEGTLTAQWLTSLDARMNWDDSIYGLSSSIFLQYGQLHREDVIPEKTQDNLILTITPSMMVLPSWNIRLFLEVTAETQMTAGMVDTVESNFIDPLFLYQTVFIGQKHASVSADGTGEFGLTYGVGYAVQQTITNKFILETNRSYVIGPSNPLSAVQSQVTLESGLSAVVDLTVRKQAAENVNIMLSMKTVVLGKEETYQDLTKARASTLILAGISYGVFTVDYTMRLLYDSNFSIRRQLEQTLVAGLRVTL